MAKVLKKKQSKKINKFLGRRDVHFALGGIAGIALYKTFEAVSHRFPELVALVDDLISDNEDVQNSDAEYDESIGEVI